MYDAIVVGARVAGAVTATLLAQRGWRVLLLDRAALPGPTVSTHFFGPTVLGFLDRLGVLEQVLATGAPRLDRWHLDVEGATYGAPMVPRSDYPYNLCVRRDALDAILLDRARREPGVEVRTRADVRRVLVDDGVAVGVAGVDWEEKTQVVVGADGRNSTVAGLVGARDLFDGGTVRCTFHAYWDDVVGLPEPALELWRYGEDILQVGPCDRGWMVMLSRPQAAWPRLRAAGEDAYLDRLGEIPAMRARLRRARRSSPVYRSGSLRNFVREPAGPGWYLVGDAVGHRDPLFGAGIADAIVGAEKLTAALDEAADGASAAERYRAAIRERLVDRLAAALTDLPVHPARDDQLAWIRGVFSHPGFALELTQRCSALFAGLPADRQRFWQTVADDTAQRLGLPAAARLDGPVA